jgi:hypothetical protein
MITIEIGTTNISYTGDTETVKHFIEANYPPNQIVTLKDGEKIVEITTVKQLFEKIKTL